MKKFYLTKTLTLILTCFASFTFGQTYYPLVDNNNKVWKNLKIIANNPPIYSNFRITTYISDTFVNINSKIFKKYNVYGKQHGCNTDTCFWIDNGLMTNLNFYLREDSSKKIYKLNEPIGCPTDTIFEYTLYDFNLNINDTFTSTNINEFCYAMFPLYEKWKVVNIDSIFIFNSFRKRITLQEIGYSNTCNWIEGIGGGATPVDCPLRPHYANVTDGQLACYFENDNWYYSNPDLVINPQTMLYLEDSCLTILNIPNINNQNMLCEVYANNGILYINTNSNIEQTILLNNILGQNVFKQTFNNNTQINLIHNGIKSSILFYKIVSANKIIKTGKLIL